MVPLYLLYRVKQLLQTAAKSRIHCYAKFQTWQVKNLKKGPWDKDGRREIYQKAEFLSDIKITLKEVADTTKDLKLNKSRGEDALVAEMLKPLKEVVTIPIRMILNNCLEKKQTVGRN